MRAASTFSNPYTIYVIAKNGLLYAIPKTPLFDRLQQEGRLDFSDPPGFGTNVIPAQMTREELHDGYLRVLAELYEPDAYFERLDSLFLDETFRFGMARSDYWRKHRWTGLKAQLKNYLRFKFIQHRLFRAVPDKALRVVYRERINNLLKYRRDPSFLFAYALKCGTHYHHYTMSRQMTDEDVPIISTL